MRNNLLFMFILFISCSDNDNIRTVDDLIGKWIGVSQITGNDNCNNSGDFFGI